MKLLAQYRRLHTLVNSLGTQPGLPALALGMHCSERNMRNLLAKMQARGWLRWSAGRGRGHYSQLDWLITPDALALDQMSDLLRQGDLEQAFSHLNEAQRSAFSARLPDYLGIGDATCRSLRMPLYRMVESLDPLDITSRLEAYLVRQVFSRLTEFDPATQTVIPALAHHWEAQHDASVWHCWLRPGLTFHDGTPLRAEDVQVSFLRLREHSKTYRRLYQHITGIEVGADLRVSFHLDAPHHLWPHCLTAASSSIVPTRRGADFSRMPIGSGAFKVVRNNAFQLTFRAFKHYYRERPLLDEIDLWALENTADNPGLDLQFGYNSAAGAANTRLSATLAGCTYLVCNPRSAPFRSQAQRLALADWMAPARWLAPDDPAHRAAGGLLDRWKHRSTDGCAASPFPAGTMLRLVSSKTPEMTALAQAVCARLRAGGVQLTHVELPTSEWKKHAHFEHADLVLTREAMYHDPHFGCFDWFSADIMLRRWMPPRHLAWLDGALYCAQTEAHAGRRMDIFEDIARKLVRHALMIVLTHEVQVLEVAPHVAGVHITPFGFAAFEELWLRR